MKEVVSLACRLSKGTMLTTTSPVLIDAEDGLHLRLSDQWGPGVFVKGRGGENTTVID